MGRQRGKKQEKEPKPRLTKESRQERRARWVTEVLAGAEPGMLAGRDGVSVVTVRDALYAAGVGPAALARAATAKAVESVRAGASVRDAAEQWKVKEFRVRAACRKAGVETNTVRGRPALGSRTLEILAAMSRTKKSMRQIAKDFGVSTQWVFAIAKRARAAGLPLPGRGRATKEPADATATSDTGTDTDSSDGPILGPGAYPKTSHAS